ncbi:unnamed protein product [Arctogadus glacialis]
MSEGLESMWTRPCSAAAKGMGRGQRASECSTDGGCLLHHHRAAEVLLMEAASTTTELRRDVDVLLMEAAATTTELRRFYWWRLPPPPQSCGGSTDGGSLHHHRAVEVLESRSPAVIHSRTGELLYDHPAGEKPPPPRGPDHDHDHDHDHDGHAAQRSEQKPLRSSTPLNAAQRRVFLWCL